MGCIVTATSLLRKMNGASDGKILAKGSIGFRSGSINISEYCHSNPTMFIDPRCLQVLPPPYSYPYLTSPLRPSTVPQAAYHDESHLQRCCGILSLVANSSSVHGYKCASVLLSPFLSFGPKNPCPPECKNALKREFSTDGPAHSQKRKSRVFAAHSECGQHESWYQGFSCESKSGRETCIMESRNANLASMVFWLYL